MTPHSEGVTCCVVLRGLRGLMELMVVLKPDQTSSRFSIVESAEARIVLHSTLLSIHDPDTRLQDSPQKEGNCRTTFGAFGHLITFTIIMFVEYSHQV